MLEVLGRGRLERRGDEEPVWNIQGSKVSYGS